MGNYLDAHGLNTYHQAVSQLFKGFSRNSIFRGKYLGTSLTQTQYDEIVAGTFDDLYLGDYWTIDGINWRIWHFDYYTGNDVTFNTSHKKYTFGHNIVVMPDECFVKGSSSQDSLMDDTNTTENGFWGTKMRTQYLWDDGAYYILPSLKELFGEEKIVGHYTCYTRDFVDGESVNAQFVLAMVGIPYPSQVANGVVLGKNFSPEGHAVFTFALSALTNEFIWAKRPDGTYEDYWTKSIANATNFRKSYARALRFNSAVASSRDDNLGIRPYFTIGETITEDLTTANTLNLLPMGMKNLASAPRIIVSGCDEGEEELL